MDIEYGDARALHTKAPDFSHTGFVLPERSFAFRPMMDADVVEVVAAFVVGTKGPQDTPRSARAI